MWRWLISPSRTSITPVMTASNSRGGRLPSERPQPPASGALLAIHRFIRLPQRGLGVAVYGNAGVADGEFDRQSVAALELQTLADAFNAREDLIGVGGRRDDDELVAGVADHVILGTEAGLQHAREALQAVIAGLMAVGIVDLFKIIEIEEEDCGAGAKDSAQNFRKGAAVGQAGERITVDQFLQHFLRSEEIDVRLRQLLL